MTDSHGQHARCGGVERAGMTNLSFADDAPNPGDDIVTGPSGRLVDVEYPTSLR